MWEDGITILLTHKNTLNVLIIISLQALCFQAVVFHYCQQNAVSKCMTVRFSDTKHTYNPKENKYTLLLEDM